MKMSNISYYSMDERIVSALNEGRLIYGDNDNLIFELGKDDNYKGAVVIPRNHVEQKMGRVMRSGSHDFLMNRKPGLTKERLESVKVHIEFEKLPKTVQITHPEQSIIKTLRVNELPDNILVTDRLILLLSLEPELHRHIEPSLKRKNKSSTLLTDVLLYYAHNKISLKTCLFIINTMLKYNRTITFDNMLVALISPEWETLTKLFIDAGFDVNAIQKVNNIEMSFTHYLIMINTPIDIFKRVIKLGGVYINVLAYIGEKLPESVILKLIDNGVIVPNCFINSLDKNSFFYSLITTRTVPEDNTIIGDLKEGNIDKVIKMVQMGVNIKNIDKELLIIVEGKKDTDAKYKKLYDLLNRS